MGPKYIKSLAWIVKLQWGASRFSFFWGIFYSLITGLRPVAETFAYAKLIANVSAVALKHGDARAVYLWLSVILAIELINQVVVNVDRLARDRVQQKMNIAVNELLFAKMYELSQQQFDDQEFNTKVDRARDSLDRIWRSLDEIYWAVSACIGFASSIAVLLTASPIIAGMTIAATIPTALLHIRENKQREAIYRKIEPLDRVSYRTRWFLTDPNYMPEIRLMNAFKDMVAIWRTHTKKSQDTIYANDKQLLKYDLATDAVQPIISFGATLYFFRMLLAGSMGLDRFIFLRGMLGQAVSGATSVSSSVKRLHELSIQLQNFTEIHTASPAIPNGTITITQPLTIEFKNVCFAYPGNDNLALDDVSFTIEPGSRLALVGENGAGKSTIIKLLLRQYLPSKGTILINGTDIANVELGSYYAAISNLSQDYLLISHLTIRDNLVFGLANGATEKMIYAATDLVDATQLIKKLPHRLDTRLDKSFDDGSNLSGGQLQRLAVARALLRNGDIMILDEPTSAVDAKAEYAIFNNIYRSHASKTTLIVSHRFSTVRKAETIIVLDQGKIIQQGTHEALLKHDGLYKEMFELQAEGYK